VKGSGQLRRATRPTHCGKVKGLLSQNVKIRSDDAFCRMTQILCGMTRILSDDKNR
jgi:hypothetical protein